jgi:hypothetical protein
MKKSKLSAEVERVEAAPMTPMTPMGYAGVIEDTAEDREAKLKAHLEWALRELRGVMRACPPDTVEFTGDYEHYVRAHLERAHRRGWDGASASVRRGP